MQPLGKAPFNLAMENAPSETKLYIWQIPWDSLLMCKSALNRWRYKSARPCYKIIPLCTQHSVTGITETHNCLLLHLDLKHGRCWAHSNQPERGLTYWHANSTVFLIIRSSWGFFLYPVSTSLTTANGVDFLRPLTCLLLKSMGRCANTNEVFQCQSQRCDGRCHSVINSWIMHK